MYRFFERLVPAFPEEEPTCPPSSLYAFCRYYTRGMVPHLLLMSVLTALIAIGEVSLFGFLGQLVESAILRHQFQILEPFDGLADGFEIGEHPA